MLPLRALLAASNRPMLQRTVLDGLADLAVELKMSERWKGVSTRARVNHCSKWARLTIHFPS